MKGGRRPCRPRGWRDDRPQADRGSAVAVVVGVVISRQQGPHGVDAAHYAIRHKVDQHERPGAFVANHEQFVLRVNSQGPWSEIHLDLGDRTSATARPGADRHYRD